MTRSIRITGVGYLELGRAVLGHGLEAQGQEA